MSAASSIASAANVTRSQQQQGSNGFAELSSEEFIKIITSEMSNQDPLKPNDTTALMEQLSTLMNIESQTRLQSSMGKLVSQNALASAGGMIGGFVEGLNESGQTVSGVVQSLRIEDGKGIFVLDGGQKMPAAKATRLENLGSLDQDTIQQLMHGMLLSGGAAMIGKTVTGATDAGQSFTGEVEGLSVLDSGVELELGNGQRVKAEWVTSMR
jgi:hypothetical protein